MLENLLDKSYLNDLQKIKETISENRYKALVVVNSAMIMTYYKIGTIINERKEWGNKYIQRLANDLKEYGRGYSYDQLKRMSRFASIFTDDEIRAQPGPQIPWKTLVENLTSLSHCHCFHYHLPQAPTSVVHLVVPKHCYLLPNYQSVMLV